MVRELVLSVSIHDCTVQTFRGSGAGGQHRNKTSSGVRVIHPPSGARGESCEERSQLQNKKAAFLRMVETPAFQAWLAAAAAGLKTPLEIEREVEEAMARREDFRTEVLSGGAWREVTEATLT